MQHINKYVKIKDVIRTSENDVIYITLPHISVSEDEEKNRTKLQNDILEMYIKEIVRYEQINALKAILESISEVIDNKWFILISKIEKLL